MGSKLMTSEEKTAILDAIQAADQSGNKDEAERLLMQLPLVPGMAKIGKELYGKAFLLEQGYNLSEAYAEFGNDWLDQ